MERLLLGLTVGIGLTAVLFVYVVMCHRRDRRYRAAAVAAIKRRRVPFSLHPGYPDAGEMRAVEMSGDPRGLNGASGVLGE